MAWYEFPSYPAVDPLTGTPVRNTSGQIFAVEDTAFEAPLPITDLSGLPLDTVSIGEQAITEPFRVEGRLKVIWKSGPYAILLWSLDGILQAVDEAGAAAEAVAAAAAASADLARQDARAAAAAAEDAVDGTVRTVNGVAPDAAGNVTVSGGGSGTVTSVNGVAPTLGNVELTKTHVGLGNVDNTADADKPVSTAAAAALALKAADVELSTAEAQSTTSSVRRLASGRRLWDAFISGSIAWGDYFTIYWTGTAWPSINTAPAAYLTSGKPIVWNSEFDSAAPAPPEARNDKDLWDRLVTA